MPLKRSNARWKWTTNYNRRSIAETALYGAKQLFGGSLTLRDYNGQIAEGLAMVRALNKMTKADMPESVSIRLKIRLATGILDRYLIYSTKPCQYGRNDLLLAD